jgi:hypothetical protein
MRTHGLKAQQLHSLVAQKKKKTIGQMQNSNMTVLAHIPAKRNDAPVIGMRSESLLTEASQSQMMLIFIMIMMTTLAPNSHPTSMMMKTSIRTEPMMTLIQQKKMKKFLVLPQKLTLYLTLQKSLGVMHWERRWLPLVHPILPPYHHHHYHHYMMRRHLLNCQ